MASESLQEPVYGAVLPVWIAREFSLGAVVTSWRNGSREDPYYWNP
jgi:hypothetical protein